jgi:dienelactone hydrolase
MSTRSARRLAALTAVLVIAVLALPRLPPIRTIVLTAALVPEMIQLGPAPLSMAAPPPGRETVYYGTPLDRMDIYLPAGAARASSRPAVVLALGVHPQPIDHPDITSLATAMSRAGVVVGVPDSTDLRNLRVTPAEPGHLADALLTIASLPEVNAGRVGLAGFSAGASIALLAAAEPHIAARVRYVSAFGGYADAERLLVDVATRTSLTDGQTIAWQPDAGIRRDVLELALATLDSDSARDYLRARLTPIVSATEPPTGPQPGDLDDLSGDTRAMYVLFTAADRQAATEAIASLSSDLRNHLAGISPLTVAGDIRAPVFLLHGAPDTAIPVAHAALLEEAIGDEVVRATIFGRFGHEQPGVTGLDLDDAGDIWELSLYLRDIVAAATE